MHFGKFKMHLLGRGLTRGAKSCNINQTNLMETKNFDPYKWESKFLHDYC